MTITQLQSNHRWPVDLEIWHVEVSAADVIPDQMEDLNAAERDRAMRYRLTADRVRFVAARSALRRLLGQRLGMAPAALTFVAGAYGRPALADYPDLLFNLSHAGSHALITLSSQRLVGIDIEGVDRSLDWRSLTKLICTESEQDMLDAAAPSLQATYFFRCWTAKEALLKALGVGITDGLLALTVKLDGEGRQQPAIEAASAVSGAAALHFHWLTDIPAYLGCIAYSDV